LAPALLALCLTAAAKPAFGDPQEAGDSVTPKLAVIQEISKSEGRISVGWREFKRGSANQVRVRMPDGRIVEPEKDVCSAVNETLNLDDLDFYDQKRTKLTQDVFLARLKPGATVLISDNGAPDPIYLRIFKDDVLIIARTQREHIRGDGAIYAAPTQSTPKP
jgi:hypothetical protein